MSRTCPRWIHGECPSTRVTNTHGGLMVSKKFRHPVGRTLARDGAWTILGIGVALGAFWRLTSWHQRLNLHAFIRWGRIIQGHPWTPVLMVGGLGGGRTPMAPCPR